MFLRHILRQCHRLAVADIFFFDYAGKLIEFFFVTARQNHRIAEPRYGTHYFMAYFARGAGDNNRSA